MSDTPTAPSSPDPAVPKVAAIPPAPGNRERRGRQRAPRGPVARVVERNITALLERRHQEDEERDAQERLADVVTRFAGSMRSAYLHLALYASWIVINAGWVPGVRPFDPSLVMLAMIASVEAIFLSTFVLISQNRMQAEADRRADLDLQMSLLAEHEVTELLTLVREIARRMNVEQAKDAELDELTQDIQPEVVLEHMESAEQQLTHAERRRRLDRRRPSP